MTNKELKNLIEKYDKEVNRLFKENKELKDKIYKIEELVNTYEKTEEIMGAGKPRFSLYKLQKILGE